MFHYYYYENDSSQKHVGDILTTCPAMIHVDNKLNNLSTVSISKSKSIHIDRQYKS